MNDIQLCKKNGKLAAQKKYREKNREKINASNKVYNLSYTRKRRTSVLTKDELDDQYSYDKTTGLFHFLTNRANRKIGDVAGTVMSNGYVRINVFGKQEHAHRLVFLHINGEFPTNHVDHINGVRNDNRLANLRLATPRENLKNQKLSIKNKSGYKGVCFCKQTNKWIAQCGNDGKNFFLGRHLTPEKASAAYNEYAKQAFGDFYNGDSERVGKSIQKVVIK
jgi:hypothetical protein